MLGLPVVHLFFTQSFRRISTCFPRALSGQTSNDPPRYPDLLEHTKLLAHSAPVDPVIEEPTQLPAPETVPGTFAEAFAWFLKAS